MTSNNYQKANEQIRLSEAQKAQILENVLSADIEPAKKAWHMPVYGWAGMMAGAFALILILILPMRPKTADAPSYQTVQNSSEETGMLYEESMETEGETDGAMGADEKEASETSLNVIRFEDVEGVEEAEYGMLDDGTMMIRLNTAEGEILVHAWPEPSAESLYAADDSVLVRNGICYQIEEETADAEMISRLKAAIMEE
ncbi:MAG: hypothetical protein IKE28_10105 [Solobacterium sp.]|nr:hypothetical protein [Solobacterium sp.]